MQPIRLSAGIDVFTMGDSFVIAALLDGVLLPATSRSQSREKTFTGSVDISSYPALRNTPVVTATGRKYPAVVTYGEGVARYQYTPDQINVCHRGRTVYVPKHKLPQHLAHGDAIGGCLKH